MYSFYGSFQRCLKPDFAYCHSDINTTASVQTPQSSAAVCEVNIMNRNQMGPNYKHDER